MDIGLIRICTIVVAAASLLLVGGGGTARAAFPGVPGLIAFTRDITDSIWLMGPDGRNQRRLAPGNERQSDPSWSANGNWLLYRGQGLWIIRPDGSGRRRIAKHALEGSWSPDGTRVVLVGKQTVRGCTDLYTMRLNGTQVRRLTATAACESEPSYSPDGTWIVFTANTDYATHVVVTRSNGLLQGRRVIGGGRSPDWSPDGKSVAFVPGGSTVEIVTPEGRPIRTLQLGGPTFGTVAAVAWSPSGDSIVVAQTGIPGGTGRGAQQIYTIRADGSDRKRLTVNSIDNDDDPVWQPR